MIPAFVCCSFTPLSGCCIAPEFNFYGTPVASGATPKTCADNDTCVCEYSEELLECPGKEVIKILQAQYLAANQVIFL